MEALLADILKNFGIGVVAGLITALLIFVFRGWWIRVLRPWYEERVYKDARIDTMHWYAYTPMDGKTELEELKWEIKQVANNISGTIVCLNGIDQGKTYEIEGSFRNLILTAVYRSTDRGALDRGTITLMLTNNGQTLKGHCAYYLASGHKIENAPYQCEKVKRKQ